MDKTMANENAFRSASTDVIGVIEWELEDCETAETLGSGKREVTANEVLIYWQLQHPTNWLLKLLKTVFISKYGLYRKQIHIGEKAFLEMCEFPSRRNGGRRGFGMSARTAEGCGTFSWEWFEVKTPTEAKKLQENGQLEIRFEECDSRWEVGYTKFLSDISFRVSLCTSEKPKPDKPTWRLNIREGSFITWPSVVNGEVVFNAQQAATAVSAVALPLAP